MLLPLTLTIMALLSRAVSENISVRLCRLQDELLPEEEFRRISCSRCYTYMTDVNFKPGMKAKLATNMNFIIGNDTVEPNLALKNPLLNTFVSARQAENWRTCCARAADCCRDVIGVSGVVNGNDSCPGVWDAWMCWPDTPLNSTRQYPCPTHIRFETTESYCELTVRKTCEGDGRWRGRSDNPGRQWTNYSSCSVHHIMKRRQYTSVTAYAVTAVAVLPALVIFHLYRQLHGKRIALHKNLLTSLLFNAVFVIWFKTSVLLPPNARELVLNQVNL